MNRPRDGDEEPEWVKRQKEDQSGLGPSSGYGEWKHYGEAPVGYTNAAAPREPLGESRTRANLEPGRTLAPRGISPLWIPALRALAASLSLLAATGPTVAAPRTAATLD